MPATPPIRTRHDELGKRVLHLLLKAIGRVRIDERIQGESRRGDVLFVERRDHRSSRVGLGVLARIAHGRVLFELFRNPMTEADLNSCLLKRIELEARDARAARRAQRPRSIVEATTLCLIVPRFPARFAEATGARPMPRAPRGFYTLLPILRTVVVVTGQLPRTPSTLWLRLLGRGQVQAHAIRELEALRKQAGAQTGRQTRLWDDTFELLEEWSAQVPPKQLGVGEREVRMSLTSWKAEGKAEGLAEGSASAVIKILDARGIPVSASQRRRILACRNEATLDAWLSAVATTTSASALLSSRPRAARRPPPRKPVLEMPLVARDPASSRQR